MRSTLPLVAALLAACTNDISVVDKANEAPTATITTPTDGEAFFQDSLITFRGQVGDGNGAGDIASVLWTSDEEGDLGSTDDAMPDANGVTTVSVVLGVGAHAITLQAFDQSGLVGEDAIAITVGLSDPDPSVSIVTPQRNDVFYIGEMIDLSGLVSDPVYAIKDLDISWTARTTDGSTEEAITDLTVDNASGETYATWSTVTTGEWFIELEAANPLGRNAIEDVKIVIGDPDDIDNDKDGYSVNQGDCDDNDDTTYPTASEICADNADNDCNGTIDDKDLDGDGHIDELCVNYNGALPIDDCDDNPTDGATRNPDLSEIIDEIDNDCNGLVDDTTVAYDDDGDGFCEGWDDDGSAATPDICTDGSDVGDCDDSSDLTYPGALDEPDALNTSATVDSNCDGLDGDLNDAIFLDPTGGNDSNDGLSPASAVKSLGTANDAASNTGRSWVLLAQGTVTLSTVNHFQEGVHLAGGYNSGSDPWSRGGSQSTINLPSAGTAISGWSTPTQWQRLSLVAAGDTNDSASSLGLILRNSNHLSLLDSAVSTGNAGGGVKGSRPNKTGKGGDGGDGKNGWDAYYDSWAGCLGCCNNKGRSPSVGGTAGAACGNGYNGGTGGGAGLDSGAGSSGVDGGGPDGGAKGAGGAGGGSTTAGYVGQPGLQGGAGVAGTGGGDVGTFSATSYVPADGTDGQTGDGGSGGGGAGGGGGGGWTTGNCDTWGGTGGGGGGGGCGGNGGTHGTGGGASVAIVLLNSSIRLDNTSISTGNGGNGRRGGVGGLGGNGGSGGNGGVGETSLISEASGAGATGGNGGAGGPGGAAGGGGGGPTIGIVCRNGSTVTQAGVSFSLGSAGPGGSSSNTVSGAAGRRSNTDGC